MHILLMPFSSRFVIYTMAVTGMQAWLCSALSILSRRDMQCYATIRFRHTFGSCWRRYGRKCVSISLKMKSMDCRSAGTNAQSCINAQRTCSINGRLTDRCPTGVATQDRSRQRALVVPDKLQRVANFHASTMQSLIELTAAAGLDHPGEFAPDHFSRRVSASEVMTFKQLYPPLEPGELLRGTRDLRFAEAWELASPASFRPSQVTALAMRRKA
jgi:Conserved region in glutamate synthase